eukprot:1818396-Rhodomonas_salina.1
MVGLSSLEPGVKSLVLVMTLFLPVTWSWVTIPPCWETTVTLAQSLCGEFSNSLQASQVRSESQLVKAVFEADIRYGGAGQTICQCACVVQTNASTFDF